MSGVNAAAVSQPTTSQTVIYFALVTAAGALIGWNVMLDGALTPASGTGYVLGLVGGIMLLLLLAYPLRKRLRFMQAWGPLKHWFRLHMVFGVLGPVLIVFHTAFHVGSLNAAVALTCMLLVAASGFVGRFIYRHIHHGLYGSQATLAELQAEIDRARVSVHRLHELAPRIEPRLHAYAQVATNPPAGLLARLWRFLTLEYHARRVLRECDRDLRAGLRQRAGHSPINAAQLRRQAGTARALILTYLEQVQRVAHFRTYERLFSLWHVLHVPLVYMLVVSAAVHVLAVHMY